MWVFDDMCRQRQRKGHPIITRGGRNSRRGLWKAVDFVGVMVIVAKE